VTADGPARRDAIVAVSKLLARAEAVFGERFPEADFAFRDPVWNVRSLETRRHQRANGRAYFTLDGSLIVPLPAAFADILKAACLVDLRSKGRFLCTVNAGRILWDAILPRLREDVSRFAWRDVTEADFLAAELRMLSRWAPTSIYSSCGALRRLADVLAGAGVMRSMRIRFRTQRPDPAGHYTLAGKKAYDARLPSREAILGVADIYARLAVDPNDRLIACVLAVLTATSFRIGEALTIPVDCLVSDGVKSMRRWGVRFSKEKSGGRRRVLETRWLTPAQAELARSAIAEALDLTQTARTRARILESHPETVPLPDIPWHATLTSDQVAAILHLSIGRVQGKRLAAALPRRRVPCPNAPYRLAFQAADVMRYLHGQRGALWVVDRGDGTRQTLSETLFIAFRHAFAPNREPNTLLVENVLEESVNHFLNGKSHFGVRSAFERFGIRERDGRIVEMTSHGFRHWVTNQAAIGGVDDHLIARWQNREHKDLQAYKHLSPVQRVGVVRDALKRGQLRGRLADMYFALHDDVRDVFLEDQVQAVHVTQFGLCTHDFKVAPCPNHLNCLKHCGDYLHDTANPDERRTLIQLELSTEQVLDQARRQQALGEADLSEHWVAEAEETLAGVRAVLAAETAPGSTVVRPFAENESRFQPLGPD